RGNIARNISIYLIKKYTSLSLKEVGKLFNMDYSAVSQCAKRVANDKKIEDKLKKIEDAIKEMSNVET
ncbi:MAG: helix-turn-helix domain-containing protein, partial [Thermoanaerobaculia bacterium]